MGWFNNDSDYKEKVEERKRQIEKERQNHRDEVKRLQDAKDEEVRRKREQESELERKQRQEKNEGNSKQKELETRKMDQLKKNDEEFQKTTRSNNQAAGELGEKHANVLKKDRERGREEKNRLAERNDFQKNFMEDRQKESEHEMNRRVEKAQKESTSMSNAKLEDIKMYDHQKDKVTKEHRAKVQKLQLKQQEQEAEGKNQEKLFELHKGQLESIRNIGQTQLLGAVAGNQKHQNNSKLIKDIKETSRKLLRTADDIGRRVTSAGRKPNPKVDVAMIFRSFQNCQVDIAELSANLQFPRIDEKDMEREEIAQSGINLIHQISSVIETWVLMNGEESISATETIANFQSNIAEFKKLAHDIHKELQQLPEPIASGKSINEVLFQTSNAIASSSRFDKESLQKSLAGTSGMMALENQ